MREKIFIIYNKEAGKGSKTLTDKVESALKSRGAKVAMQSARSIEEDISLAQQAVESGRFDCVVAAGGDSTIRGVATGLRGSDLPLGIIPAGTGNVMAQEIGLKKKADLIANTLLNGEVKTIYGATANETPFYLMSGAGFDADIVAGLSHSLKKVIGKAAYTLPVFKTLLTQPLPEIWVRADEKVYTASWVIVTNIKHYGGTFLLSEDSALFKPGLHAVLFQPLSRRDLVAQLIALATNRLHKRDDVLILPCEKISISASKKDEKEKETPCLPVQIDGERFGLTPLEIISDPKTVQLILPI